MSKEKLISIHNSGESFEKSVALYYATIQTNYKFYSDFDTHIYYAHNLPKTKQDLSVHGTVGFYEKYFSNNFWCPPCKKEELWNDRTEILNMLVDKKTITSRVAEKLNNNIELYWSIIKMLPLEYIYPIFYYKLIKKSEEILQVQGFFSTELEQNCQTIYELLPNEKKFYSIYALESNGIIGHYDMFIEDDYRHEKKLNHLYSDLRKKIVLSGNSAILLASIYNVSKDIDGLIGYRNHKHSRQNRDFALSQILTQKEGIIEPKNINFNNYYDKVNYFNNIEEKSNEVVALAYDEYIKNNIRSLKL